MSDDLCSQGCDQLAHPDDGGCPHGLELCSAHTDHCVECRYDLAAERAALDEKYDREQESVA